VVVLATHGRCFKGEVGEL